MFSALPSNADIHHSARHVSERPIVDVSNENAAGAAVMARGTRGCSKAQRSEWQRRPGRTGRWR